MQQLAFSFHRIVFVPGGAVTNAGSWPSAAECKSAAGAAFRERHTAGASAVNLVIMCAEAARLNTRPGEDGSVSLVGTGCCLPRRSEGNTRERAAA
jgi:hypothetical protein